jgi:hypothetical protein
MQILCFRKVIVCRIVCVRKITRMVAMSKNSEMTGRSQRKVEDLTVEDLARRPRPDHSIPLFLLREFPRIACFRRKAVRVTRPQESTKSPWAIQVMAKCFHQAPGNCCLAVEGRVVSSNGSKSKVAEFGGPE